MIVKIHKPGRSFRGVCRYLTHDAKAETTERVAWTHNLNLASAPGDVPSAVNEMLWTYRAADALKREAGVATGGSRLEKPVKHFSLAWPRDEAPTRDHMIETVQAYMKHMGYADRQAVLVAHDDKRHAHVHVVMNSVSPEDGRAVRSSHDWRRAEAFALQYEREHGQIHCEQRLKPREERDPTPTRDAWQRMKRSETAFERVEIERLVKMPGYFERHDDKTMNGREWEALKAYQKQQREQFFVDGKQAYRDVRNAVFREVREEFRGQWNAFYAAKRGGIDKTTLAEMKIGLMAAQNRTLEERRTLASDALREQRDQAYEAIKTQQAFDRSELGKRQEQGLRTYPLMDIVYPAPAPEATGPKQKETPAPNKTPWKPHAADWGDANFANRIFGRAGQFVHPLDSSVHPLNPDERECRGSPGELLGKRVTPTFDHTTDGVGRTLREASGTARPEPARRAEVPRAAPAEMTDAASERARAEKTREMTDQRALKEQSAEVTALRASWNRHRRQRGERD